MGLGGMNLTLCGTLTNLPARRVVRRIQSTERCRSRVRRHIDPPDAVGAIWQILQLRESGHQKITATWRPGGSSPEGTAIQAARSLLQLFERIEDLKSREPEVPI